MKFEKTKINGVFIIENDVHTDPRGIFVKTFKKKEFLKIGLEWNFHESYYTSSKKNVIRGMHFQVPPHDHSKLITIIHGAVVDVILDLRSNSPTFRQYIAIELSFENQKSIYIPRGCAHGFSVIGELAIAAYMVTSEHAPDQDKGIRFNSFGYNWPVDQPILSERDLQFPTLAEYKQIFA